MRKGRCGCLKGGRGHNLADGDMPPKRLVPRVIEMGRGRQELFSETYPAAEKWVDEAVVPIALEQNVQFGKSGQRLFHGGAA